MTTTRPKLLRWIQPVPFLAVVTCLGCGDDKGDFEVISLEGKVEKITLNSDGTGEISVRYYSEKHKQEIVGTGLVTRETEILINGVVAKLSALREGERIRGEVRVDKKGPDKRRIALKISVDRARPVGGG